MAGNEGLVCPEIAALAANPRNIARSGVKFQPNEQIQERERATLKSPGANTRRVKVSPLVPLE